LDEYVRVFSAPGAARAGFEYYRQAFSDDGLSQAKTRMSTKLEMPILTISGSGSLGAGMEKNVGPLGNSVRGIVLEGCGHYVLEECGGEYAKAVIDFLDSGQK
jgi:pimeloyl-ACP methyl ester carboxylesterase